MISYFFPQFRMICLTGCNVMKSTRQQSNKAPLQTMMHSDVTAASTEIRKTSYLQKASKVLR